ncbi:MAG: DUF5606 domain-containing protein [Bacteroidales bacterium]|nr:DUF5606 domain-containing protein [Bacteroidales bacterium]
MDLKGILSIGGYSGLYKLIKQTKNGFVVESLTDKKRMQAFATSKISTLEDIAIYTETGEVSLKDVFKKIFEKENGKQTIGHKSSADELKNLFAEVLPDYDRDRVYVSDIKKVVNWYNQLVDLGLIDLKEDEEKQKEEEDTVNEEKNKEKENDTKENKA